jgi:hypothetical protein
MRPSNRTEPAIHGTINDDLKVSIAPRCIWTCLVSMFILFGFLELGTAAKAFGASKDVEIVMHGVCKHFSSQRKDGQPWNERNPGVALRMPLNQKGSLAFQGGAYNNSYSLRSFYAGVDWLPIQRRSFGFGAGIGAATGYHALGGAPVPMGNFMMQWKASERLSLRLRMLPPVHPKMTGVAALEIGLKLPRFGPVAH